MNEFTNEQLELFKLIDAPHTKELLINYVGTMYEEHADFSDESLRRELIWLHDNNQLINLFIGEAFLTRQKIGIV
jgi:hypothetical protein